MTRAEWAALAPFQRIKWVVTCVPRGQVASYGQIGAIACGTRRAARMVGWALHGLTEAEAEVVPWWRIINSSGRISSSCREHSAERQRELLEREGVEFGAGDHVSFEAYLWPVESEVELLALAGE